MIKVFEHVIFSKNNIHNEDDLNEVHYNNDIIPKSIIIQRNNDK